MLKPTNDPIRAYRREMEATTRAAREGNSAGGTQPFQAVDKLKQQIEDLRELVIRLPQVEARDAVATGFGLSDVGAGAWKTVASVSLPSPGDKNRVVVQASAQGAVLDQTTGGLTSASCRLLVNGVASPVIPASKDAGANVVNNVFAVSMTRELTPLPGTVTVQFQMSPLNPDAFDPYPSNIANLSVYAGYSVV